MTTVSKGGFGGGSGIFPGTMAFDQLGEGHLELMISFVALTFCLLWLVEKVSTKPIRSACWEVRGAFCL